MIKCRISIPPISRYVPESRGKLGQALEGRFEFQAHTESPAIAGLGVKHDNI